MDLFDELESQLNVDFKFATTNTICVFGKRIVLDQVEAGVDFLTGTSRGCRFYIKFELVESMSSLLDSHSDLSMKQALELLEIPVRVMVNQTEKLGWWLGVSDGAIRIRQQSQTVFIPMPAVRFLKLLPVDNSNR